MGKDQDRDAGPIGAGELTWAVQIGSRLAKDKLDLEGCEDLFVVWLFKHYMCYFIILPYVRLGGGPKRRSIFPFYSVSKGKQKTQH